MQTKALEIATKAKARAREIIESNQDCISYVSPEDLETQSLFIPVVSVIKPQPGDFYDAIPRVGIMAKPPLVNLIREKAGIEIVRTETEKRAEFVYVAHVYGRKRQPDGTMLTDDASYEFDAKTRAELDWLESPDRYMTEARKKKRLLTLVKFGEQRAVTGAQHALIHKLAHVARSFKTPQELMRGMIICRIDRNVEGILADPGMRELAVDWMLGANKKVFGPTNGNHPETPGDIGTPAGTDEPFDAPEEEPPAHDEDERTTLVVQLEEYRQVESLSKKSQGVIDGLLNTEGTTIEDLRGAVETLDKFFAEKGGR